MTANYSKDVVQGFLEVARDRSATTTARGRALEDLVGYLFEGIPGVSVIAENAVDVFACQELDVVLENDSRAKGLYGFEPYILVECKNWTAPVGSSEIAWLDTKLRCRGLRNGLLVAMSGITGKAHSMTSAHNIISAALAEERRILVLEVEDIEGLENPEQLVRLCRERLFHLISRRSAFSN